MKGERGIVSVGAHTVSERWAEHNVVVLMEVDKLKQSIISSLNVLKLRKLEDMINDTRLDLALGPELSGPSARTRALACEQRSHASARARALAPERSHARARALGGRALDREIGSKIKRERSRERSRLIA